MKKTFKKIIFVVIALALVIGIGVLFKTGHFTKLEGYMYSLAIDIAGTSTDSNATSCDATSSNATSSNATSSNAECDDATSSNATSCDATSSNATSNNIIKVTNNVNKNAKKEILEVETTQVEEEKETDFEFDNSEITKDIIEEIKSSDESRNVIIKVNNKKIINKEIFEAIKGTSRQLTIKVDDNQIIFNGKDITNAKDIDTTMSYNLLKDDKELNIIEQNGVVINFANNGDLPGTATVKIKATADIKKAISLKTIYVYYYDESTNELLKMTKNAVYKDGYIEFAINHNSKYVFVNEEITKVDNTMELEDNKVSFLESHKMYVIIIIIAVFTIAFVTLILIIDKKSKNKANR